MKNIIIGILVVVVICIGFYIGYRQAVSTKLVPFTPPPPTMTYDEQTAKAAEILAKLGPPKPLLPSIETTQIIEEIAHGMKTNLDLVHDARGSFVTKQERIGDPQLVSQELKIDWTLKGNRIKYSQTMHSTWTNNTTTIGSCSGYANGSVQITFYSSPGSNGYINLESVSSVHPNALGRVQFDPFRDGVKFDGMDFKEFKDYVINERNGEFNVLENSLFNGDSCYVIEPIMRDTLDTGGYSEYWGKIWIDPKKGYGQVHSEHMWILNNATTYNFSSTHYEYGAFPLPDSSRVFWYPKLYQQFLYDSTGKLHTTQEHQITLNSLNQNLSDRDVDILWQPGIQINEMQPGNQFIPAKTFTIAHAAYTEDILSGKEPHIPYQYKGPVVTYSVKSGQFSVTTTSYLQRQMNNTMNKVKAGLGHWFAFTPWNLSVLGGIFIVIGMTAYFMIRKNGKR